MKQLRPMGKNIHINSQNNKIIDEINAYSSSTTTIVRMKGTTKQNYRNLKTLLREQEDIFCCQNHYPHCIVTIGLYPDLLNRRVFSSYGSNLDLGGLPH